MVEGSERKSTTGIELANDDFAVPYVSHFMIGTPLSLVYVYCSGSKKKPKSVGGVLVV